MARAICGRSFYIHPQGNEGITIVTVYLSVSLFTTPRSKVKSRSHHDAAHLQLKTNVPTKYQLPTSYDFQDIALTRFCRSKSLQQGQIKVTI